jgi:hypothetical protein
MRLIAFLLAGWTAWNAKSTKCLSADSLFWANIYNIPAEQLLRPAFPDSP